MNKTNEITLPPHWEDRISNEQKLRRNDQRSVFQRDRARILHSAAFRRLQAKTQVHGPGSANDFYRTRLTHSLEVSQIGTGVVAQLKLRQPEFRALLTSTSLMESICLAHDIGHPPFGHGGEIALNYMMRDHGGFEGNGQTLRILSKLEPYTEHFGMNLARRTLLGVLKYPAFLDQVHSTERPQEVTNVRHLKSIDWHPPKGVYRDDADILNWILKPLSDVDKALFSTFRFQQDSQNTHRKTRFKSIDCSIMELADDIAYGVHDLEDAIVMGIVTRNQWQESVASKLAECGDEWFEANIETISDKLFSGLQYQRKDGIGSIVNALLTSITIKPTTFNDEAEFESELLRWNAFLSPSMSYALEVLKKFVGQFVIHNSEMQRIEYKGQQIVMEIFDALNSDPERLLPENDKREWREAKESGANAHRVIADYIAGMTDGYAQRLYNQLFVPI